MKPLYMRAARTLAAPGMYAYDAEMKVEVEDGNILFLHANYFEGEHFTAADFSQFDFFIDESSEEPLGELMEEYDSLNSSVASRFYLGFKNLDEFVDEYMEWREQSGEKWLLENTAPDFVMEWKGKKPLDCYEIQEERIADNEGSDGLFYVIEAEIQTNEEGVQYFYQGEWVEEVSDSIYLSKRNQSVFEHQLDDNYDPDEIENSDVIEQFSSFEEAARSNDAAIYARLYDMLSEYVEDHEDLED